METYITAAAVAAAAGLVLKLSWRKFDSIDKRFTEVRADITRLDDKLDKRFTEVRADITRLDDKLDGRFTRLDEKFDFLTSVLIDKPQRQANSG